MERYFDIDREGRQIQCKLYYNEGKIVRRLVLFCHGFTGHRDNGTTALFAARILPRSGDTAVIIFNWPAHGEDRTERITLRECAAYLRCVLEELKTRFPGAELYAGGQSFGGFMLLHYLSLYGNPFRKVALRCPAVNMHDALLQTIMTPEETAALQRGETVSVGFDRMIRVDADFLEELRQADVQKADFHSFAEALLILQGTADEVIDFETVQRFAEQNGIPLSAFEGADHRFQAPDIKERMIEETLRFFDL